MLIEKELANIAVLIKVDKGVLIIIFLLLNINHNNNQRIQYQNHLQLTIILKIMRLQK